MVRGVCGFGVVIFGEFCRSRRFFSGMNVVCVFSFDFDVCGCVWRWIFG